MPTVTYIKIASYTVTVADTDSTIVFSNIPQSYTDLEAQLTVRNNGGNFNSMSARINSLTSGYSYQRMWGTGGGSISTDGNSGANDNLYLAITNLNGLTTGAFSPVHFRIYDYTNTSYIKCARGVGFAGASSGDATRYVSHSATSHGSNTAAVTSLTFRGDGGAFFRPYSTITLYGIK